MCSPGPGLKLDTDITAAGTITTYVLSAPIGDGVNALQGIGRQIKTVAGTASGLNPQGIGAGIIATANGGRVKDGDTGLETAFGGE